MRIQEFLTRLSPVGETLESIKAGTTELEQQAAAQNARLAVTTADEAGLSLWEADWGIADGTGTDIALRRSRILAALSGGQCVTPEYLRRLCVTVGGADWGEVVEDFGGCAFTVTAVAENRLPSDETALREAVERQRPAHLVAAVVACGEMTGVKPLYPALSGTVFAEIQGGVE